MTQQLIALLTTLSMVLSGLSAQLVNFQKRLASVENGGGDFVLGAVVSNPNFPSTGFNHFEEGEVVEEEDWNQIEYFLGTSSLAITSSTATSTINYRLNNSGTVDPGHLHTSSAVSSTISIAKGGTGTSTVPTIIGAAVITGN